MSKTSSGTACATTRPRAAAAPAPRRSPGPASGLYFRGPSLEAVRPKPFLRAFRFPFVAYPGKKLEFWGRTPSGSAGKVKIELQEGKRWKLIKTLRADRSGIFRGKLATSYGRDKKGAARAVAAKQASAAFSMKPVPDFHHPPFG